MGIRKPQRDMEMVAACVGGPHQGLPCSLLSGFLEPGTSGSRHSCFGPRMFSWDFRLTISYDVFVIRNWSRSSIRVSPSHSYYWCWYRRRCPLSLWPWPAENVFPSKEMYVHNWSPAERAIAVLWTLDCQRALSTEG